MDGEGTSGPMRSNAQLVEILRNLRSHVTEQTKERPRADVDQIVHGFLAAYDLAPAEQLGIVDALRAHFED